MKLTVLGKYGPYPGAGGATTSYLLECGGKKLLIDAGSGSLSRVQEYCALEELDGIILTHLHSDHCSDMFILRYLRTDHMPPVFMPCTPETEYGVLHSSKKFEITEISEDLSLQWTDTDIKLSFCRTIHPVECYAVKVESEGKTFVFTGDSRYSEKLTEFCSGVDALLCDSGFLSSQEDTGSLPHMYVREAGVTAKKAGVKRLWLSHINPSYDEGEILKEAKGEFAESLVVQEFAQYEV